MDFQINEAWTAILADIKRRVAAASFETWFKGTEAKLENDSLLVVITEHPEQSSWLSNYYKEFIESHVEDYFRRKLTVKITNKEEEAQLAKKTNSDKTDSASAEKEKYEHYKNMLNPRYTFDTFVVGGHNRFAHAASLAVAEQPAKVYNPLFLYGGVGLGKTHLMHAIGHFILDHNPEKRVLYLSSEKFTNEFINSIRDDRGESFRNKYRSIDVLLIDDIQFLAGKDGTQEEFFHTFNDLHLEQKQIVITSDRQPSEIPSLEDRLRSRFGWGLITDIQAPDVETRTAILQKKARSENIDISNEAMSFIANQIDTNIRELEGALNRVVAYATMMNQEITPPLVVDALKDLITSTKPKMITIQDIQAKVGEFYNLKIEDFKARRRTKQVAFPRQVAMYLARELTDHSLPKIGSEFGGRDHSTVIHAHEKIMSQLSEDVELSKVIKLITEKIKNIL